MPEDYAKATARPGYITIGDAEYRVAKFGPRTLGDLTAWLKKQVPDPRLMARELCKDLPDAVAMQVWKDLCEEAKDWPPSLMTPEGNQLLAGTHDGATEVVLATLGNEFNPSIDRARAREIAAKISVDKINELISAAFPEPTFDPKDPGSTETPS